MQLFSINNCRKIYIKFKQDPYEPYLNLSHNFILGRYKILNMMNFDYGIHQGILHIQSGFRSSTAIIQCPYIPHRIQVSDATDLQVLQGAQVYWREVRKFYVNKKNSNKQQLIISAAVIGLKHCKYIYGGINIIATIDVQEIQGQLKAIARPLNKKLPNLEIIDFMGYPATYNGAFSQYENMAEYFYWIQILSWNFGEKHPKAFVTGIFNQAKTAESETEAILYGLQIQQRQANLIVERNLITPEYLPVSTHRKFNQLVFTIDPQDCIDMEDALSLKILNNSLYEVGVHISDVSSFMNLVDRREICLRGTSFYLPHKTIQMFPKIITELCSFQPKKQRLSFSIFFRMNQNGDILQTKFEKTIVQSVAKLTYQEAQQIIESQSIDIFQFSARHDLQNGEAEQLIQKLKILKQIAFKRRKIRKSQDVLDRNQVTFDLDKDNIPIKVGVKKRFDSERLIEQFMIATNGEVAKKLVKDYGPNSLVIHHPKPSQSSINNLNTFFSDFGVRFKNDSIISLETQMKKLFEKEGVKDQFKQALMMRAIQIQELAVYSRHMNSSKGHYGLNMEYYTHFTSPLRRFADIITHEQLTYCLLTNGHKPKYQSTLDEEIELANKARIKNKKLKHSVVEGFLNLYLYQHKQKIRAKAMVMSLGLKSATLYLPFYNLIKQVNWTCPVSSSGKQSIIAKIINSNGKMEQKILSKNDSIDIEMQFDSHQQVKITMFVKNIREQFLKI